MPHRRAAIISLPLAATAAVFIAGATLAAPAFAQAPAAGKAAPPAATAAAPATPPNPVVARVNGQEIMLSDVTDAARGLPENMRQMPQAMLFSMILERQVDLKALSAEARKQRLDKDPAVQRQIALASDAALQNALLAREVGPKVTDEAIRARYDSQIAGKPGEEEVHAKHILVASEDEAKKIIAELKKGADFSAEAKKYSTDPGGKDGGDLGWFKKADMVPEFADAAFAMQPGQTSDKPVKSQFGWHIIKLEERRTAAPPTFEASRDQIRQQIIQDAVRQAVQQARAQSTIETFNMDGSPKQATDTAEPPPAK